MNGAAMASCHECDFPVDAERETNCRKCGSVVRKQRGQGLLEVDVAHAGESWEVARMKIERAVDDAFDYGYDGIKVVHGYGSTSGRSVIGPQAISYLRHIADEEGGRFTKDARNPGASLVWFNQ